METTAREGMDGDGRAASAATERLCIATRQVRPVGELIRFVTAPDNTVVPDLKRRLPGRGVWVTARRRVVADAVRRRLFVRAFKADVRVPPELLDELDKLLVQSALNALSIARKAGLVVQGFAKTEAAVLTGTAIALVRARDAGGQSGRRLAAVFARRANAAEDDAAAAGAEGPAAGKVVEAFTSAQLDLAMGRLNVVHAALLAGRASETFLARWRFLEDFRAEHPV